MRLTYLFLLFALLSGVMLTVALSLNARLGGSLRSPLLAGMLSFAVGTVFLAAVSLAAEPWLSPARLADTRGWAWTGGLLGAFYLAANIVLIPRLGALTTIGLAVAGQMVASLVIDHFGLLNVAVDPLTAGGVGGTVAAVLGAGMIAQLHKVDLSGEEALLLGFSVLIGAALPAQAAINAELRAEIGAPLLSGGISFAVGTLGLAAVLGAVIASTSQTLPAPARFQQTPRWAWFGGLFAALYVDAVLVPLIGAAATIGFSVAGQQLASTFVDHFGWFGLPRKPVTPVRVAGVVLLLVGVALIQVF